MNHRGWLKLAALFCILLAAAGLIRFAGRMDRNDGAPDSNPQAGVLPNIPLSSQVPKIPRAPFEGTETVIGLVQSYDLRIGGPSGFPIRAQTAGNVLGLRIFADRTHTLKIADIDIEAPPAYYGPVIRLIGDDILVSRRFPLGITDVSLMNGEKKRLPVSQGAWNEDEDGAIMDVVPAGDGIAFITCDRNAWKCDVRRYDPKNDAIQALSDPFFLEKLETVKFLKDDGADVPRVLTEAGDGAVYTYRILGIDAGGLVRTVDEFDSRNIERSCTEGGAACEKAVTDAIQMARARIGTAGHENDEVDERCFADPEGGEENPAWFRIGCYVPSASYDLAVENEGRARSHLYCGGRTPCNAEIVGLNVVVHVPVGLTLREEVQAPWDSGTSIRLMLHDGSYDPGTMMGMYATSSDYGEGVGEGFPPYAGPALDLTRPLEDFVAKFPRPNARSPRIVEMDGRKGLLFYWMGELYGDRTFQAMLVIPNPDHAYSNIVFPIPLESAFIGDAQFDIDDMPQMIASHQEETARRLAEIDAAFDIK